MLGVSVYITLTLIQIQELSPSPAFGARRFKRVLSRALKTSYVGKTYGSCSLSPKAQALARPAKFDMANLTFIASSSMRRASMASSSSTNHLNKESLSTALYLETSIFKDSGRRVYVDPAATALACCCLNSSDCGAPCYINKSAC